MGYDWDWYLDEPEKEEETDPWDDDMLDNRIDILREDKLFGN